MEQANTILIVEDEHAIADLIQLSLAELGRSIDKVGSAEQARFLIQSKKYDVVLLDWMLPGEQGIDFLKYYKKENADGSCLMLTAKADPDSIVQGLESGADDYLIKPFDRRVLLARVKNLLRRHLQAAEAAKKSAPEVLELANLRMDLGRVEVRIDSEPVHLTPSEFKLLGCLLKTQGRVLTRDQLIDQIQGEDVSVTGRTIDTHVFALRKKLGAWADHIETIRGVGYRVNFPT